MVQGQALKSDAYLDTLRLTDSAWRSLVAKLNARPGSRSKERREDSRSPMLSQPTMEVSVTHPAGNQVDFQVRPHNLSRSGMAFLHGQFLYPRTPAQLKLRSVTGLDFDMTGEVVYCRLARGMIHEVGLRFSAVIDPAQFLGGV